MLHISQQKLLLLAASFAAGSTLFEDACSGVKVYAWQHSLLPLLLSMSEFWSALLQLLPRTRLQPVGNIVTPSVQT